MAGHTAIGRGENQRLEAVIVMGDEDPDPLSIRRKLLERLEANQESVEEFLGRLLKYPVWKDFDTPMEGEGEILTLQKQIVPLCWGESYIFAVRPSRMMLFVCEPSGTSLNIVEEKDVDSLHDGLPFKSYRDSAISHRLMY